MIAEALRRLAIERGTCVEFGAHDGFTFSNTARLWRDASWRAALIEPDPTRFRTLVARTAEHDCLAIRSFVEPDGPNRLDAVLERAGFPTALDVLSIDIDGDDVGIVRHLGDVRARILVCEYNPTMPWDVELEGDRGTAIGCSLSTLVRAADTAGYSLIGVTRSNGIFVARADRHAFDDLETAPEALALRTGYTYVVTDYAGRAAIVGPLPYRHRPGRLRMRGGRDDVRLRWTARGAVEALQWKAGNVLRQLRTLPPRDSIALVRARLRRR